MSSRSCSLWESYQSGTIHQVINSNIVKSIVSTTIIIIRKKNERKDRFNNQSEAKVLLELDLEGLN